MISDKLGVQFVIVTHANDSSIVADKTFIVKKHNGKSVITNK